MAGVVKQQESSRLMLQHDNGKHHPATVKITSDDFIVAGGRLSKFANGVGHKRDGYCRVTDDDPGNHSVAATMTSAFLDFTNARGNNLESTGVKASQRWCLCASRWKEAYDAFKDGKLSKDDVPRVHLHASDKKALGVVSYSALRDFKAAGEATREGSRQGTTIEPGTGSSSVREGEISGSRPGSDQHYGKIQSDKGKPRTAGA